jgi:hypothetical protein
MSSLFDQKDFSIVVKHRASPPKPWRWEIYRAGRTSPIECSSVRYETVEARSPEAAPNRISRLRLTVRDPELELRLDVGRLTLGCIDEREDRRFGNSSCTGFVTNLALGAASLLERQISRRHLIFGPAIGTFEDDHRFIARLRLMM